MYVVGNILSQGIFFFCRVGGGGGFLRITYEFKAKEKYKLPEIKKQPQDIYP